MSTTSLSLLHITDTHLFADPRQQLRDINTRESLDTVLQDALQHRPPPDAILVSGDISHDESAGSYRRFRELLARPGVPVLCLPGNHDVGELLHHELNTAPFQAGGEAVFGSWTILLLDSTVAGEPGGRLSAAALDWLTAMLEKHRQQHIALALHHHVLPLGSRWLDGMGLHNAAALLAVLDQAPGLRLVLAGHVHQASDIERHGVRFFTTPSTCFQFLPRSDDFALDRRPPGYRWLNLQADGRIDTSVGWSSLYKAEDEVVSGTDRGRALRSTGS